MDKVRTIFWFTYDILFSFLITSVSAVLILDKLTTFKWYLLTFFTIAFLISAYYMISFVKNEDRLIRSLKNDLESADSRLDFNLTYLPVFGFIAAFGLINYQLYLLDNSLFTIKDEIGWIINSKIGFLFYSYDNFIRAACLDFFETYNFHISNISASDYWILTILFIYKTFLSSYFLKYLWTILKELLKLKTAANPR